MTLKKTFTGHQDNHLQKIFSKCVFAAFMALALGTIVANALEGDLRVHDPSTVAMCKGKYYVYSTGPGIPFLTSDDGFHWKRGGRVFEQIPEDVHAVVPGNDGKLVWAPDIIHVGSLYYLYYSVSKWDSFNSAVALVTSPTLDPQDPGYKWTNRGVVVLSNGVEDLNAIDPGVMQAPDGRLWLTYGSYHGPVRVIQLDPKTGLRPAGNNVSTVVSTHSEASDMMYRDGYYYLLVNHGTCCKGAKSTYNIRIGRSKSPQGRFLDSYGVDMAQGGSNLFLAATEGKIGPGHFGRLIEDDGVEKFSCHYESSATNGAHSTLDIRPLLWGGDGWPIAGQAPAEAAYQVRSQRTGTVLAVQPGTSTVSIGDSLALNWQRWTLKAVGGYYQLLLADGGRALQAVSPTTAEPGELGVAPPDSSDAQLWKIDQLTNGSYRIQSKTSGLVLDVDMAATPRPALRLFRYKADDAAQQWLLAAP